MDEVHTFDSDYQFQLEHLCLNAGVFLRINRNLSEEMYSGYGLLFIWTFQVLDVILNKNGKIANTERKGITVNIALIWAFVLCFALLVVGAVAVWLTPRCRM